MTKTTPQTTAPTRRPRRYQVATLPEGTVTLWYTDDDSGAVRHRIFWCPVDGGYVRDVSKNEGQLGYQVCKGLSFTGETLRCERRDELANLIRREMRRALREQARITN